MYTETMLMAAVVGLAMAAFWLLAPRCPECSSLLSSRNSHDPRLRHCRRCLAVYRPRGRR